MKRMGWIALVMAALIAGCRSPAELNAIAAKARTLMTSPEYVIGEGDTITIRVLQHDEFALSEIVRPDGKVSFPQHGEIVVAGKTTGQLRKELGVSFQKTLGFKKAPKVFVAANSFGSKSVTVIGEVRRPGTFPYRGQMRVADLLGLAIGVNESTANGDRTVLFREVDGATKIYAVNVKRFWYEGAFSTNFFLRPGDILFVPMNGFAKAAQTIRMVFLPVSALFDVVGLGSRTTNYFVGN